MNELLKRRVNILEQQLAHCTCLPLEQVAQDVNLALRIPDQGSPSSYGGHPSPGSTHSEPIFPKTEEQDDIDQIIAPTQRLHVRSLFRFGTIVLNLCVSSLAMMGSSCTAQLPSLGLRRPHRSAPISMTKLGVATPMHIGHYIKRPYYSILRSIGIGIFLKCHSRFWNMIGAFFRRPPLPK